MNNETRVYPYQRVLDEKPQIGDKRFSEYISPSNENKNPSRGKTFKFMHMSLSSWLLAAAVVLIPTFFVGRYGTFILSELLLPPPQLSNAENIHSYMRQWSWQAAFLPKGQGRYHTSFRRQWSGAFYTSAAATKNFPVWYRPPWSLPFLPQTELSPPFLREKYPVMIYPSSFLKVFSPAD